MLKHLFRESGVLSSAQHSQRGGGRGGEGGLTLLDDVGMTAVQLLLGAESDIVAQEVAELHQHVSGKLVRRLVLLLHVVGVGRLVVQGSAHHPPAWQSRLSSASTPGL